MQDIYQVLKQYWGFDEFRPGQKDIIKSVLKGKDTLALLPTGGGKSLCFQLPALINEGMCVVVSPLIALMKDQVFQLNKKGIKAVAVYSGMTVKHMDTVFQNASQGAYKFLYLSPERLMHPYMKFYLYHMKISLIAVDEAHCISQWGYDFRPAYLKIAELRAKKKNATVIALTATATPEVCEDIQQQLQFKEPNQFFNSFVRKNLSYVVRKTPSNKSAAVLDILQKVKGTSIVYLRTRKGTKEISDFLNKHHIKSDFYHAGLQPYERMKKQENWMEGKIRVICCTNAFGMGIDKPDVRTVIHPDVPETIEAYFQEAGRAGRDEKKAYAVLLYDDSDIYALEEKIANGFPTVEFVKKTYEALCSFLRIAYGSGQDESYDFDIVEFTGKFKHPTPLVLAALKILEQQKILEASESVYSTSHIKAITPKNLLYQFQVDHRHLEKVIKFVLRSSPGIFEDFVPIDEEAVAIRTKFTVEQVTEQLKTLDRYRIFKYQPRKNKPQIYFLENRVKTESLLIDREFVNKRKKLQEEKLRSVISYVQNEEVCRTHQLVSYFGEEGAPDCGVCDVCLSKKKSDIYEYNLPEIASAIEKELRQSPLSLPQLRRKLIPLKTAGFQQAIDHLLDNSKIQKNKNGEIEWIA